jgi:5-methyltetrahydrofolate--homocysteine methyltransferase
MNRMNIVARAKEQILLLDGAMGTELLKRGIRPGTYLVNIDPHSIRIVEEIHRQYLDSGADIIETNTSTGTKQCLEKSVNEMIDIENNNHNGKFSGTLEDCFNNIVQDDLDHVTKYNLVAATLAMNVAGRKYVAGAISTIGKLVSKTAESQTDDYFISWEDAYGLFIEQVGALNKALIDFYLIETMYDVNEAKLALKAAKNKNRPVAVSFSIENSGKTLYGNSIADIVGMCRNNGADMLGINCVKGIEPAIEFANEVRKLDKDIPLIVYPNAGIPDANYNYPQSPEHMASKLPELLSAGVNVVGGCCGTTPQHIRLFREVIDDYQGKK